jgi:hypothetical protein
VPGKVTGKDKTIDPCPLLFIPDHDYLNNKTDKILHLTSATPSYREEGVAHLTDFSSSSKVIR